jgi:hypothetical protein
MLVLLGTGGGFGASREFYVGAADNTLALPPDAAPKLVLMLVLALLLAVWAWDRPRSLDR